MNNLQSQVLFQVDSVYIHTLVKNNDSESVIEGKLNITKKNDSIFIEWLPKSLKMEVRGEWEVINQQKASHVSNGSDGDNYPKFVNHRHVINFDILDLRSIKKSKPTSGVTFLIFILKCGTTYPALHFHKGKGSHFFNEIKKYVCLQEIESSLFVVKDKEKDNQKSQLFTRSLEELDITPKEYFTFGDFMQGVAKVGKIGTNIYKSFVPTVNNFTELSNHVEEVNHIMIDDESDQSGFAVIVNRDTKPNLPPKLTIKRHDPLEQVVWSRHMNEDGKVKDVEQLKEVIFRGGVDPAIRSEVWKFLLGYYRWDSTFKSRTEQRKAKVDDYFRMKLQWKSINTEQEKRFSQIREMKNLIDKDVTRTDRNQTYFENDNNSNVQVLYDVLMTYVMYDFDLGYVQGMSDLLAPILVVVENEVDAFWCFCGFMDMIHANFEKDQSGMKQQLSRLQMLLSFYDPEFYNYLKEHESNNMFFCFRWLLIIFKREFSFSDIMRLWEVYWTMRPCPNFQILMSFSVLLRQRSIIIESKFGFTEILKHINDLANSINLTEMLIDAEAIYLQLSACNELPEKIAEVFGISVQRTGRAPVAASAQSPKATRSPKVITRQIKKADCESDNINKLCIT